MYKLNQNRTPYLDALKKYLSEDVLPLDVPGHHMGNVPNKLKDFLGDIVYKSDVNAPIGLDNLSNPKGVILEAEELFADFAGADNALFLIDGTSSGIIAMIMAVCHANDKIILPRNVHKSIVNALIISGASPVYIMPELDKGLEIANQPSVDEYIKAMKKYPSAKAIFVINPTYFGAVNDLKRLVEEAHSRGIAVLVDEAHGAHYYFDKTGPISAMEAGADLAAVSFHKTGGSLTQSSVLFHKAGIIDFFNVRKALNFLNTTSPSTLLIASLDTARQYVAMNGQKQMDRVHELSRFAREEISKINGFKTADKSRFIKRGAYDYDDTKLVIRLENLDINGFDLYHLLKKDYAIQMELAETNVIMGILAIGSTKKHMVRLVNALKDVSKKHYSPKNKAEKHAFSIDFPFQLTRPRTAYHASGKLVPLEKAENEISKESIMIYPPGIPLIVPGEVFNKEIINRIETYRNMKGVTILSDYGVDQVSVVDVDAWTRYGTYRRKLQDYIENRITTPRNDEYYMPFEGNKHSGTIILLPYRKDTWRANARPALNEYKNVIKAIAKFEPVYVGISPKIYKTVASQFEGLDNVKPFKVKYNDSWARDTSPIFVTNGQHLRAVDFRFNAWGGEVDGLYSNYKDDDAFAHFVDRKLKIQEYRLEAFILEGGSIHVDGEGTCIVTKACLLSKGRNPTMSQNEIEEMLKTYLNVSKVIWLEHGIYNDETNEHVDNMACFIKPGVVALAWTDDKEDPQYKFSSEAYKLLRKSTDALDRPIKVVKVKLPKPIYSNDTDAKGIRSGKYNAVPRVAGTRLAASYINFYQGENFVIMPGFGDPQDAVAKKQLQALYPNKEVIQIYSREILLGGGNIHCITMQIPYMKGLDENEN